MLNKMLKINNAINCKYDEDDVKIVHPNDDEMTFGAGVRL